MKHFNLQPIPLLFAFVALIAALPAYGEHGNSLGQNNFNSFDDGQGQYQPTAFDRFQQIQSAAQASIPARGAKDDAAAKAGEQVRQSINKSSEEFNKNIAEIQKNAAQNAKELAKVTDSPEVSSSITKSIQSFADSAKFTSTNSSVAPLLDEYGKAGELASKMADFQSQIAQAQAQAAANAAAQNQLPANGENLLVAGAAKNVSGFGTVPVNVNASYNIPGLTNGSGVSGGHSGTSTATVASSTEIPPPAQALGVMSQGGNSGILNKAYNTQGISLR